MFTGSLLGAGGRASTYKTAIQPLLGTLLNSTSRGNFSLSLTDVIYDAMQRAAIVLLAS